MNRRTFIGIAAFALTRLLLRGAGAATPAADLIGEEAEYRTLAVDTLADIAVRFDLGYDELVAANRGIDPWLPGTDTPILLPGRHILPDVPRTGIVINLGDQRLYHFRAEGAPRSYPIGIAADNDAIVLGTTRIVRKRERPVWVPPASIRAERPDLPEAVAPGPNNPLGSFALDLGWPAMVIHGTNKPYGIGRRVSHGCFRLYESDIAELFREVTVGIPVIVVYQPVKIGWDGDGLMLEIHPDVAQQAELDMRGDFTPDEPTELPTVLARMIGEDLRHRIEWDVVALAAWRRNGRPVRIDRPPVLLPPQ